jgi:arylsulfatase A-like enzyme
VLLVVADALRRDHLEAFGYRRATAPNLARVAEEGARFADALAQGSATRTSLPSILTSLHPASHGVLREGDRLPGAARTAAELFREAGYATVGYAGLGVAGRASRLQQGFEVFHEAASLADDGFAGKTSRAAVDRLLAFLELHRDVPVFAFLHVADPRAPHTPRPPYADLWADPTQRAAHRAARARVAAGEGSRAPGEAELRRAGVDPRRYVEYEMDLYDGAIRGMDAELVRVFERLQGLGLAERSLVAFTSDHGTAFHEHGHMLHGHSLYAELLQVPLLFWGPGRVPAGLRVDAVVQTLDVLPTLLALADVPAPAELQGRNLAVYFDARVQPPLDEPAYADLPRDPGGRRSRAEVASQAVHSNRWKLIHNTGLPEGLPELELYDRVEDPFEQRNLRDRAPDVAERLGRDLEAWRARTRAARLPGD